jgi:hypothetical protein
MKRLRRPNNGRPGKRGGHLKLVSRKTARQRCTLLDLIQRIQDTGRCDDEVVATIARLIENGRVVLYGTFAGIIEGPSESRAVATTGDTGSAASTATIRFAR